MIIRPARDDDYPAMASLLRTLAQTYVVPGMTREVAATFLRNNDETALRAYCAQGHAASVAVIDGEVAGFIAIRPPNHLFYLFVGERWQRRGVARALWQAVAGDGSVTTVNASPHAVPAYERLGFRCDGPAQCVSGVTFQPMVF